MKVFLTSLLLLSATSWAAKKQDKKAEVAKNVKSEANPQTQQADISGT